ncbi:hypothetical protein ACMYYO_01110 [Dermacoccaceae bacterium W4C1]
MADRLVRPYRMALWSAGTMVTFAFVIIPVFAAVAASGAARIYEAGSFEAAPEEDQNILLGGLAFSAPFALYLGIASCVTAWRFVRLRRGVQAHYADLARYAGRNPELDWHIEKALIDDRDLHRIDRRRRVLSYIGAWFMAILDFFSTLTGGVVGSSGGGDWRGPRAGQFGYKFFWGLLVIGGGTVGVYFLEAQNSPESAAVAAGVFAGVNVLWWLPSLWRSVALRRVDAAWREGAEGVRARIPGGSTWTPWRVGG